MSLDECFVKSRLTALPVTRANHNSFCIFAAGIKASATLLQVSRCCPKHCKTYATIQLDLPNTCVKRFSCLSAHIRSFSRVQCRNSQTYLWLS